MSKYRFPDGRVRGKQKGLLCFLLPCIEDIAQALRKKKLTYSTGKIKKKESIWATEVIAGKKKKWCWQQSNRFSSVEQILKSEPERWKITLIIRRQKLLSGLLMPPQWLTQLFCFQIHKTKDTLAQNFNKHPPLSRKRIQSNETRKYHIRSSKLHKATYSPGINLIFCSGKLNV